MVLRRVDRAGGRIGEPAICEAGGGAARFRSPAEQCRGQLVLDEGLVQVGDDLGRGGGQPVQQPERGGLDVPRQTGLRGAFMLGGLLGGATRYLFASAIVLALGLVMGYRPDGGALGMLAAVALVVAFGLSLSLLWAAVALAVRDPADPAASADAGKSAGVHSPVHTLAITVMRMPLLDNLDLEPLSGACAEASRAEFMLARDTAERPRRDGPARRSGRSPNGARPDFHLLPRMSTLVLNVRNILKSG